MFCPWQRLVPQWAGAARFGILDLSDGELLDYSYTVLRGEERERWYDPQPHPQVDQLAATFPHHYHEEPDIRRNRRPAPGIGFKAPNLPRLISDCIALGDEFFPEGP